MKNFTQKKRSKRDLIQLIRDKTNEKKLVKNGKCIACRQQVNSDSDEDFL